MRVFDLHCRRWIIIFGFLTIWTAIPVSTFGMTADQWFHYQAEVGEELRELAQQVRDGQQLPIKCATPIYLDILQSRPTDLKYAPVFTEREDSMSYTHVTSHFSLHYTDNGANAVYQFDTQTITPGVPDYIVHAGRILDSVWEHTVVDLGFPNPVSDGYYNGGGNGLLDVYFINTGAYGVTVVDSTQATTPLTATVYLFLENDYEGFPGYETNRLNALRVTAAHEFTHAVQFALDLSELEGPQDDLNPAWIEMSATYMEQEHYPAIDDYLNYLPFFYRVPSWSVRTGTFRSSSQPDPVTGRIDLWRNLHMYGSAVFPLFLSERYGPGIIGDIWQRCGNVAGPNWISATDQAIANSSGSSDDLATAFQEFALWNLFTGHRDRPGYFPDAALMDTVYLTTRVMSYPAQVAPSPDSVFPDNLGANYIVLENAADYSTGLSVDVTADFPDLWGLTVVKFPFNIGDPVSVQHIRYDTLAGSVPVSDAFEYERIALILSVLGGDSSTLPYEMNIGFLCGDVDGDPEISVGDIVFLINYLFKLGPEAHPTCAGDANGDGSVNVGDAVNLVNYIFKEGPAPSEACCP